MALGAAEFPPPDSKAALPAWQCVALSLDIAPSELGVDHFLLLNARNLDMLSKSDPDWIVDMRKRLEQLTEALHRNKSLRADKRTRDCELDTLVVWQAFLKYARSKRWKLPKPLHASATKKGAAKKKT